MCAALSAAALVPGGAAGAASPGTTVPTGPLAQALQHSLAAATKAGSARITVEFYSGSTTGRVVQDSSLQSGQQTVAIGKALASVVLNGGTAYISGNAKGMTSYFGLPNTLTATLSGRWIAVQPSDSSFSAVTANVALPAALGIVTPSGKLVAGKRTKVNGQRVKSISGTTPGGSGRLTLFISRDGRSLPVEAIESTGSGRSGRGEIVKFSRWGESVHPVKPTTAVPLSAIEAASSASGSSSG